MKHTHTRVLGLASVALLGTSSLALAEDASTKAELDALRARVEALESSNAGAGLGDFSVGNTSIDIYGYVKADFFYDFDSNLGDFAVTSRIGESNFDTDGNFGATLRQSRLGFRTSTQSDIGELGSQLEFDLFNGGADGGSELRLRHANITIGDSLLIGQYWTNFMPLNEYPTTVEFNGPVGIAFNRVPQIRYTHAFGNTTFSASVEDSFTDSDDPIVTGAFSYNTDRFSARIAGLYGTVVAENGEDVDTTGVTVSGSFVPWQGGRFTATYVDGEALGPLLIGGGEATFIDGNNDAQANDVEGYTLEYRQDIGDKWNVGIAYGRENYDAPTSTGALAFTELETFHVNAFYHATDNLTFSAEYLFGERNDAATGNTFDGDRVQLAVQLNF